MTRKVLCFLTFLLSLSLLAEPQDDDANDFEYIERDKSNPYKSISQTRYSLKDVEVIGGLFYETPLFSSHDNFSVSRPGFYFGISQILKDSWVGGVELRYSEWKRPHAGDDKEHIGILSLLSSVNYNYRLDKIFHKPSLHNIRLYLLFGLGYSLFTSENVLSFDKVMEYTGQGIGELGFGFKHILNESMTLKYSVRLWRGFSNNDFISMLYMIEFGVGDGAH